MSDTRTIPAISNGITGEVVLPATTMSDALVSAMVKSSEEILAGIEGEEPDSDEQPVVAPAKPKPALSPLNLWRVRDDVEYVIGYWDSKTPVVHRDGSKCAQRMTAVTDVRNRSWLLTEFDVRAQAEDEGAKRTLDFCTRCVTMLKSKVPPAQLPAPTAEELAADAADAEAVQAEIAAENTALLIAALDKDGAVEMDLPTEKPVSKAQARRDRAAARREVAQNA